jgi:hypothetical protein
MRMNTPHPHRPPWQVAPPQPRPFLGAFAGRHAVRLLLGLLWLAVSWPLVGAASERHDHERAREALARGQVLPLGSVLDQLARQRPGGHVLEVELERSHGRWVYEIKQMDANGRLVKFKLDAQTGVLLTPGKEAP